MEREIYKENHRDRKEGRERGWEVEKERETNTEIERTKIVREGKGVGGRERMSKMST